MKFPLIRRFCLSVITFYMAGAVISGCSSSTTETPPVTNTIVTPKAGTTYTYAKHQRDSTSGSPSKSYDTTIIAKVDSSNITFDGKSGVIKLLDDVDTLRYVLETSGDVSIYLKQFGTSGFFFTNPKPWMLLPFGAKTTGVSLFDTTENVTIQTTTVPVHIVGMADYLGTDEITKNGSKFASGGQVKVMITATGNVLGTTVKISSIQTYSFDGSIGGYFHSIGNTTVPDVVIFGTPVLQGRTTDFTKILTDFTLIK